MRPRRTRLLAIPVLATSLLALSACGGDDPTGNSGDALTAAEAEFFVSELFGALSLIQIPLLSGVPAQTPYGDVYPDQIDASDQCGGGGLASIVGTITGDVDQQAGTGDINIAATVDFDDCIVPGETVSFTVNGNPDIGMTADISITQTAITIDIGANGGVSYVTSDGRSGSCSMDLAVAASSSSAGISQSLTGTACGQNANTFNVLLFD
jgi:hypothetical protein